ncbi:MAG: bifunctional diaminohydroxyphosphoribosylaminopyrimidine deaminase/5-amino-6-(5-phosphoribosylamino)uracil reductase RibD [Candidatus Omnitrophica bacterium]|nr:bifunctional diaminohydroxyphosphoribosylaminopyrimidine deaminase/5-amino-6-(5-phosphoribosylamino)uracil reductase RibD [Candidatus Omnitrophota bacterium]
MPNDLYFIKKTFSLAKKAEGFTSPNPIVGAVITRNGKIVGRGYHKKSGLPHAEIEAIKNIKGTLKGTELYVNLEPCCHWGKTGPCVDKIIESGIKKVVIACYDPNPRVRGRSVKKMKKAGIAVKTGILKNEAEILNEVFFKNMKKKLPFITAKSAQSLDGKIAAGSGDSKWITGEAARLFSKSLRDKYDAVAVGVNTVIKDDPVLEGIKKSPYKVIFDGSLRIPLNSKLVKDGKNNLIIFSFYKAKRKKKKIELLKTKGRIYFLKENKGLFNLRQVLKILFATGIMSLFVEGGSVTLGRFFDSGLVDKVYFFFAPKIIGGSQSLTSVSGTGVSKISKAVAVRDLEIKKIGDDFLVKGYPCYKRGGK